MPAKEVRKHAESDSISMFAVSLLASLSDVLCVVI